MHEGVVKLSVRDGASISFLRIDISKPVASVVLFAGYDGDLQIGDGGIQAPSRNFLVRTRSLFARNGFAVAVIDSPTDNKSLLDLRSEEWHAQDIAKVVDYMRQQHPVPVWLVGTSRGTISVVNAASRNTQQGPDGIVLTASVTVRGGQNSASIYDSELDRIAAPTLVVHHRDDGCYVTPALEARKIVAELTSSKTSEYIEFTGGSESQTGDTCGPTKEHGFAGIESAVVTKISEWIMQH